jgi:hypothetical protein
VRLTFGGWSTTSQTVLLTEKLVGAVLLPL